MKLQAALVTAAVLTATACRSGEGSNTGTRTADLSSHAWNDGVDCSAPDPDVVQLAEDTFVFRQPLCVNFEGPFLYLFLGRSKALLLDSGTKQSNMAIPVLAKVDEHKAKHGLTSYPLVVGRRAHALAWRPCRR